MQPSEGDEADAGFMQGLISFFTRLWGPGTSDAERQGYAYLYDEEGSLIAETGTGGANSTGSTQYIYLPTANGPMPIAAVINGNLYAVHSDHLNTPRRLTNSQGQPVWQWAYSAFGDEKPTIAKYRFANLEVNPNPGTTSFAEFVFNLRGAGQYFDVESGLRYNYFRSLMDTGRYTQPDPVGLGGGLNRIGHVGGNPLLLTDPLGLQAYKGQTPPSSIPGGPWTPAGEGQRPGTFYGPKQANGPRAECRYVPDESNGGTRGAKEGYWKTQEPGQKGWSRFDQSGSPITPEQAHPGNQSNRPMSPLGVPGWMPLYPIFCPLCDVMYSPANGPS